MKRIIALITLAAIIFTGTAYASPSRQLLGFGSGENVKILMYHRLSPNPEDIGEYCISPEMFENDIVELLALGYTIISPKELAELQSTSSVEGSLNYGGYGAFNHSSHGVRKKYAMLTFDDGYRSDHDYVLPLLEKYKVPALFSIFTKAIQAEDYPGRLFCTWDELNEMQQSPYVTFASHGNEIHEASADKLRIMYSSPDTVNEFAKDVEESFNIIHTNMDIFVEIFSYPYGINSPFTEAILKQQGIKQTYITNGTSRWNTAMKTYQITRYNRPPNMELKDIID